MAILSTILNGILSAVGETVKKSSAGTKQTGAAAPTVTMPKQSARQRMLMQEDEEEDRWYKGNEPTSSEILARIYTIGKDDPKQGEQLWSAFSSFANDPSSPIYNPYSKATNQAISELSTLGFDMSRGVDQAWYESNAGLKNHYRFGTGGTPLSPTTKSTKEENAAYWYHKLLSAEETTQKAENEWAALQEEIAYWTQRTDRNYSDQEILDRIDWSNYKTLASMDEARQKGTPLALNRSVGYSQDALAGVIWAARNGGSTGNAMIDSVKAALGEGKSWVEDAQISAKLDPTNPAYSPYSVGGTLDEAALYFGVNSFDANWLDQNRAYLNGRDATAKKYYQKVYDAEQTTAKAEKELEALWQRIEENLKYTSDPDIALDGVLGEYYGDPALNTLKKMDESRKSGDLMATTRAIDYRWEDVEAEVRKRCEAVNTADNGAQKVLNAFGLTGPSQSTLAVSASRDNAINAAGKTVQQIGTPEEKIVWKNAYSADFDEYLVQISDAMIHGEIDTQAGYASVLEHANEYAAKAYMDARKSNDIETLTAIRQGYDVADRLAALTGAMTKHGSNTMSALNYAYRYGGEYKPTDWAAKTLYDEALAQGHSYAEVAGAAKQGAEQMRSEIQRIDETLQYLADHSVVLDPQYIDNMQREKAALERSLQDAEYFSLMGSEDFETVIEKTRAAVSDEWSSWKVKLQGSDKYSPISAAIADPALSMHADERHYAQLMTDEEKNLYWYILGTEGQEAADRYFAHLTDTTYGVLPIRESQGQNAAYEAFASQHPVAGGLLSMISSPLRAVGGAYATYAAAKGNEISPNHPYMAGANMADTLSESSRDALIKQYAPEGGWKASLISFGYEAIKGAGESLVGASLFGPLSIAQMGAGAMARTGLDAQERGGNDEQILLSMGAAFAAETLTEMLTYGNISKAFGKPPKEFKSFLRTLLGDMGEEAFGEGMSELLTSVSDDLIMKELSNRNKMIAAYMTEGMSAEEAETQAFKDIAGNVLYAAAVGGVSGGISTSVGALAGRFAKNGSDDTETAPVDTESTQVGRWVTALTEALSTDDEAGQTATVAAILAPEGTDMETTSTASAAAQHLAEKLGVKTSAQLMREMLLTAAETGVDAEQVRVSMVVAALGNGAASAALESGAGVAEVLEAAKADMQSDEVKANVSNAVLENQIATRVKDLIADGGLSGVRSYEAAVADAKANLEKAQGDLKTAQDSAEAAGKNLQMIEAEWSTDPDNAALRGAVQQAIKDTAGKAIVVEQYTQSVEKYEGQLRDAQDTLAKVTDETMLRLREQARQDVMTAKEQAAQQKAEAEAQKAVQQQEANITSLEAQSYIEAKHSDAPDAQKQVIHDRFSERASQQQSELESRDRFARAVSRRFSVNIKFVDRKDPMLSGNRGGYSRKGNTIFIANDATQGDLIRATFVHELTHRAEQSKKYDALKQALLEWKYGSDTDAQTKDTEKLFELYETAYTKADRAAEFAKSGQQIAESELIARIAEELIGADEAAVLRLVEGKPSVARQIADAIREIVNRFRGVNDPEVENMRRVEKLMRQSLDEIERKRRSEYRKAAQEAAHPSGVQFSVEQLAEATGFTVRRNDDGVPYSLIDQNGNEVTEVTPQMLHSTPIGTLIRAAQIVKTVDEKTAEAQMKMFADLATLAAQYKDQAMVWEIAGSQLFSAIKSNSDNQYGTTVDFGTICTKTQAIVDVMSATMVKLGRGLTRKEVLDAYRETAKVGYNVPCPVCYVFSRWMGVPSLLGNMAEYQRRFDGMSEADVRAYVADVESRYDNGEDKPSSAIAKAKSKIEGKLARIEKNMLKRTAAGKDINDLTKKAEPLEKELEYIEAYNWVTQVLCKKNVRDENGQVVLDPDYQRVPDEILLDLSKTGEFAQDKYKKSWTYRTTRGAGMGKAILPHSGARIGDSVKGTKDRWSDLQNAFLTGDDAAAERAVRNAIERMKAKNLIGGQRFQSTSDYRPEWGIDYMMTFLEMQAIGAKGQLYTKVIEAVDMFATAGIEVNLSIMPKGNGWHVDENGNKVLDFSSVTGIDFDQAYEKVKTYDNVQMILVGINDDHIELAMADDRIMFIIPWHASGSSGETLATMMGVVGEKVSKTTDYTKSQSDKVNSKATVQQKAAMDLRMRILTGSVTRDGLQAGDQEILDGNKFLADLYDRFCVDETATETYHVELNAKQASQVFPYEYWDTNLTLKDADINGWRFREYCESIGLKPRFPQFADKKGYWKLLIDRSMYNLDGTYHHPQQIDVTNVKINSVAQRVGEVKYGDSEKTERAVQATLDDIRSRIPAEQYADPTVSDAQFAVDEDVSAAYTEAAAAGDRATADQIIDEVALERGLDPARLVREDATGEPLPLEVIVDEGFNDIQFAISYPVGDKKPDLTLQPDGSVADIGQRPRDYVPKKIGYAYKLMEQHPDGTLHALFAGTDKAFELGVWNWAEGFSAEESPMVSAMNLFPRYGWHMGTGAPSTHHLMGVGDTYNPTMQYPSKKEAGHPNGSKRVWCRVAYDATNDYNDVADNSGTNGIRGLIPFGGYYAFQEGNLSYWILSSALKFDKILTEDERAQILKEAGVNEEENWQKQVLPKKLKGELTRVIGSRNKGKTSAEDAQRRIDRLRELWDDNPNKPYAFNDQLDFAERKARGEKVKDPAKKKGMMTEEERSASRETIAASIIDNPDYNDVQYALPSGDLLDRDIDNWLSDSGTPNYDEHQTGNKERGERQYATKTAQESPAMPDWLKHELLTNEQQRYYEKDHNDDQIVRSWTRISKEGYEAARDRLLAKDAHLITADDVADANMVMAMANRYGDARTLIDVAHHYNVEGTREAKAFQARQIFSRMTPAGVRAMVAGQAERLLAEHIRTHQRQAKKVNTRAAEVAAKIKDFSSGDELKRLTAAGEYTIDATNSKWGVPLNEQQLALIAEYDLENVKRPVFYNRATTKQRMLEAIIATPNPLFLTGNGLNLIQRLEYLKAREAVITNADLQYIGRQLTIYAYSSKDDQDGRVGDLALARAYEANGNIYPASLRDKLRTWRYVSMLLSLPSAGRNIIGNGGQNILNAAAHTIAVELDKKISEMTGSDRTRAHLTAEERAEGWYVFREESVNTYRDFFVDKAVTERGENRYNLNQRGRVYQWQPAEAMRLIEGFLMSFGDRNFWKRAFANSMAEQQRVAELNGAELDYEAALEQAKQDADYATFSEDGAVKKAFGILKGTPIVGDILDFVVPFTGVPTNIVKRMWQFSPAGLVTSAFWHAGRGLAGKDFQQGRFVDSMARGLTGSAMFAIGMALRELGAIKLGTGDEEDKKVYGVRTAQGDQYTPYIQVGDDNISLSPFAPAASALIMGATAHDLFKDDEDKINALYASCLAGLDQIFDASYMSAVQDIFTGQGSTSENIGQTVLNSAISQNVPSILGQIATGMDDYVRDTKDKNFLMQALKSGLIQKLPWIREQLPEKVDVAGRSVQVGKEGVLRNLTDPMTLTEAVDDPALNELMRLNEKLKDSDFLPNDLLSGAKTALTGVAAPVEGKDKEAYKKRYGELWRLGGTTYDKEGNSVFVMGVTDLIQTSAYQKLTDQEKANAIKGIVTAAKTGAVYETAQKLGHEVKAEKAEGYEKAETRAMPTRFADSDSPMMARLNEMYEKTGDGAFIPKAIASSFSVDKVQYTATGEDYEQLWDFYERELDARLAKVKWNGSDEEIAAAVNSAYSSAATAAKKKYAKYHR